MLEGVRKLTPGTLLVIEPDGSRRDVRYWSPSFSRNPAHEGISASDREDAVLEALLVAVERRMVSDVLRSECSSPAG